MKKILLSMCILLSTLTLVTTEADARRLGGGGSSGRQSSNVSRQAAPAPSPMNSAARPAAPAAAPMAAPPVRPPSPWRGIVGGALLGLGMGALLSHFGMGGAMGGMFGSILMIVLLVLVATFIFRLFRRKTENLMPMQSYSGNANYASTAPYAQNTVIDAPPSTGFGASPAQNAAVVNSGTWTIPADFDAPGFLRHAKAYFIRLQAAWDKADLNDMREFTTTEMFAEFRLELQERGASANVTDVVSLEAEMLGVETSANDYLASVKFTGLIKESPVAQATPFAEVWNLSKPVNGQGGWVLAGIQQLT